MWELDSLRASWEARTLTGPSPQVLEQRRLLLPPDNDAHVDGVCGQHGPKAGLRAGDPAGRGKWPGGGEGAATWGDRLPCVFGWVPLTQETRALGSPMPCQSCTGDMSGSPAERKRGWRGSHESR